MSIARWFAQADWSSVDANRISNTNSAFYMIYSAPMEIVIASYMLYR